MQEGALFWPRWRISHAISESYQGGIAAAAIREVTYANALAVYGLSGAMQESDWLEPSPIDQRNLFEGNSILRGGQQPRIEAPRRAMGDLRIS